MQQSGANVKLVIDTETTYKTNPGSPDGMILPFVSESIQQKKGTISSKTIRADRNPQRPGSGNKAVGGDIGFELSPEYGRLLKHIFGSYSKTGEAAPYTHTFKIGSLPVGMFLMKQFGDLDTAKYFWYNGLKVNSFKLSAKTEGMIDCSVNLIGAKETISAAVYDATPTDLGHTPFDSTEITLSQGGSPLAVGTTIDFTLENGLDGKSYTIGGGGEIRSLPAGTAKVTGTLEALFENDTLYALAVAGTETTLTLEFGRGTKLGASAGNECLAFYIDELKFSGESPVVSGPTGLLVKLPFEGYYADGANASALRAVLLSPVSTF